MKGLKILVVVFAALSILACNETSKKGEENAKSTKNTASAKVDSKTAIVDEVIKPKKIGKDEFVSKIFNYEANPKEWVFEGDRPCVIDFYADWCKPCKQIAPILDQLAIEYEGKVDFYKINVDEQKELAQVFGIQSIPTFYFVPVEGKPKASMGAMPRASFVQGIEEILNN